MNDKEIRIEVKNLSVGYKDRIVLKEINFKVHAGEIVALLGGSGCGKSTLLKHMIGLLTPLSGEILIEGENIVTATGEKKRKIMQKFGVSYQSGALFGSLSVKENINLPLEEYTTYTRKERDCIIQQKLELVNLRGFEDYMPAELSGGMKKRAALARALALNPRLLFFDEPSAGLDPISSAQLDHLLLRLRDQLGVSMVLVTHELDSIFKVVDQVLLLDKETKTMIAHGNPSYLRDHTENPWVKSFLTRQFDDQIDQKID